MSVFKKDDVWRLLGGKTVIFLGDSNTRAIYKDVVVLYQENRMLEEHELKSKLEPSFCGDQLVARGKQYNGRNYREERVYMDSASNHTEIGFFYLTRILSDYMMDVLEFMRRAKPNVIIINSCMWDVTRYGVPWDAIPAYKENMRELFRILKRDMPNDCLVIWVTTMPISQEILGGFLVKELEFVKYATRFHIEEANEYAYQVVNEFGFDLFDAHEIVKSIIFARCKDGIHWYTPVVRHLTNLLLRHVSLAWGVSLPQMAGLQDNCAFLDGDNSEEDLGANREEAAKNISAIKQQCTMQPWAQQSRTTPNQNAKQPWARKNILTPDIPLPAEPYRSHTIQPFAQKNIATPDIPLPKRQSVIMIPPQSRFAEALGLPVKQLFTIGAVTPRRRPPQSWRPPRRRNRNRRM